MPNPTREPFIAYLLVHAAVLRRRRDVTSGAVERLQKHAQALELLAELLRSLPEDDERLLMLATLAVRDGQFVPGPATEHALSQFADTSREAGVMHSWTTWFAPHAMTPWRAPGLMAICHRSTRADLALLIVVVPTRGHTLQISEAGRAASGGFGGLAA